MASEMMVPHSSEAEAAVLGSVLIDPEVLDLVAPIVRVEDFLDERHRTIFKAMKDLGYGVDQLTLAADLQRKGKSEQAGGLAYLSQLVNDTPTSVNAEHYARIVADTSYQRRVIEVAGTLAQMGYKGGTGPAALYGEAQGLLSKLAPDDAGDVVGPIEHAEAMVSMLSRRRDKEVEAVAFGYPALDALSGGTWPGDLVLVGARPSVGKSQVLLEIALHNATLGRPVLFASAEMSLDQLMERELCMQAGLDMRRLRRGELSDDEWGRAQTVVAKVAGMPLHFLSGKLTVTGIAQRAQALKNSRGLALVVVDYVQLLHDRRDARAGDTLRERVGFISGSLKAIAVDCQVPVIAASQFNRAVEARDGHLPMLADLKESGDLEQDADMILLLHRPELYEQKPENAGVLMMKVGKNRQTGVTGVVKLAWNARKHRYEDKEMRP